MLTVFSPKGRFATMDNRKHYGVSFTNYGQITYTHNGISYVSDREHAVILPKGQSYTLRGNKEGNFAVINFECPDFFVDTIKVIPIKNADFIMREFEQIKKLQLIKSSRLDVMSTFYNILSFLDHSNSHESNLILPAITYMENNYHRDITNKKLAKECNISEEYFRKIFKKTYGISPKQYVTNMRINRAKLLLSEGTLKIKAISEQCGFSNQYHFCRFFKKKVGLTPTEFLKQNRIVEI